MVFRLLVAALAAVTVPSVPAAPAGASTPPPVLNGGSEDYAGYITQGGSATYIAGTFNIPTSSAGPIDVWVGVGQSGSSGFAQAGVEMLPSGSGYYVFPWTFSINPAGNFAWGPKPALAVTPGDTITVTMTLTSPAKWLSALWAVTFRDDSTGGTWAGTLVAGAGDRKQTEWIVESPGMSDAACGQTADGWAGQCPLGQFTPVSFIGMAQKGHISFWMRLVLSRGNQVEAVPSWTKTPLAGFQVSPPSPS